MHPLKKLKTAPAFILLLLACMAWQQQAMAQFGLHTAAGSHVLPDHPVTWQLPDRSMDEDSLPTVNKKRLRAVILTESALFATSMFGLYHLWYKDYPQSGFHWFNDNNNWLQMDKVGHGVTSYYIGKIGYETLQWCNVDEKRSVWFGGTLGFVYLLTIETLDGFSKEWGASTGDLLANISGSGLFIGQQLLWEEQRFTLKFSFHQSPYADYRPDLFGQKYFEQMIKDYNGQTYWLSANLSSFCRENTFLPDWLNVAVGYGVDGLTGAVGNERIYDDRVIPVFERNRQFYLSLDADLTRIKTNSEFLKILFKAIGFIKIPFPALEYNTKGEFKFHGLYF